MPKESYLGQCKDCIFADSNSVEGKPFGSITRGEAIIRKVVCRAPTGLLLGVRLEVDECVGKEPFVFTPRQETGAFVSYPEDNPLLRLDLDSKTE